MLFGYFGAGLHPAHVALTHNDAGDRGRSSRPSSRERSGPRSGSSATRQLVGDRLVGLQDDSAIGAPVMFGRTPPARHDLRTDQHRYSCKRSYDVDDADYRDTFDAWSSARFRCKRVLEDASEYRQGADPPSASHRTDRSVGDAVESCAARGNRAHPAESRAHARTPVRRGDVRAGRVYRNLVVNAIQARRRRSPVAAVEAHWDRVQVSVYDPGSAFGGPPPVGFEDFLTPSAAAIVLGLAITRKIVSSWRTISVPRSVAKARHSASTSAPARGPMAQAAC